VLRILDAGAALPGRRTGRRPRADELPPTVDLGLLQQQQTVTYYAALPGLKPFSGNFAQPGQDSEHGRFVQANQETPDLYTQAAPVHLAYLKKTVRLVAEFEPRDAYTTSRCCACAARRPAASSSTPPSCRPACRWARRPLFLQLRRLLDALQAKVSALYGHHREPSRNVIEFRSGDMSSFWLLHTASTACAALTHYLHHPDLHPERLYEQLLATSPAA
jgi:type VI secretion system protein ImpJ